MVRNKKTAPVEEDTFTLPTVTENNTTFDGPTEDLSGSFPPIKRRNPPTIKIVIEAITKLDDKKGSTYVAIKNWTMANYPEMNRNRMKFMLSKALAKGMKDGKIRNLSETSDESLTSGRFKIVVKDKKKIVKKKALANITNVQEDPKEHPVIEKSKKNPKAKKIQEQTTAEPEVMSDSEVEVVKAKKTAVPLNRKRRSKSAEPAPTTLKSAHQKQPKNKTKNPVKNAELSKNKL